MDPSIAELLVVSTLLRAPPSAASLAAHLSCLAAAAAAAVEDRPLVTVLFWDSLSLARCCWVPQKEVESLEVLREVNGGVGGFLRWRSLYSK